MDAWLLPTITSGNKTVENNELPLISQIPEADPLAISPSGDSLAKSRPLGQMDPTVRRWKLLSVAGHSCAWAE